MQIINPLQLNDFPIKKFLIIILSLQVVMWGFMGLFALKIQIPLLKQIVFFVYLTFIPGFLILRILGLHELGNIKTILFTVSLSFASIMLITFSMNLIFPLFGVSKPLTSLNIILTISMITALLCCICYYKERNITFSPNFIDMDEITSPITLLLCLLPFLSIFAAYAMNMFGNNVLQLILLLIISIFPVFMLKWIPEKFYPLAIFSISIALLFHTSLISQYIWGTDVNVEYYFSNIIINNSIWDSSTANEVNAMLSTVMLLPTYSKVLNVDLIWIIKIGYPVFFSLVPLGLYLFFKNVFSDAKIAFFACFFFISLNVYYVTMLSLPRQEIAELFLVNILILLLNEKIQGYVKSLLLLIFGFGLVVSHYGTSYIFILLLLIAMLIVYTPLNRVFRLKNSTDNINAPKDNINTFILFLIVLSLAWFIYASSSTIFIDGVLIGNQVLTSFDDLLSPATAQGAYLITTKLPIFQSVERLLYLLSQVFITIGLVYIMYHSEEYPNFNENFEFKFLSIASFLLLIGAIILPNFASKLNTDRIFHITLFVLAPFFVIGFLKSLKILNITLLKVIKFKINNKDSYYIIAGFLMIFLLFNSAVIYQIFDEPKTGRFALDNNVDFFRFNNYELQGANWMKDNYNNNTVTYADIYQATLLRGIININKIYEILYVKGNKIDISDSLRYDTNYIFIGTKNSAQLKQALSSTGNDYEYLGFKDFKIQTSKIYENGGSSILLGSNVLYSS